MGMWQAGSNVLAYALLPVMFYAMFVGQGMFSGVQQLQLNGAEACAVASFCFDSFKMIICVRTATRRHLVWN